MKGRTITNVSKCPLGRYDFEGIKRRPGTFSEKKASGLLAPRGDTKKQEKSTPPTTRTQEQLWLMFRFGTGDTVVARVGIADGSRAKYVVGI